jgi:hypothetical protein
MNNFLIILNILLATGVAASLGSNIKRLKDSGEQFTVPKRQPKVQVKSDAAAVQTKAMTDEEKATAILEGDIFNPDRSPLLNSGGGGRSEMTLAGTYKVGDVQGAIVIVRNRQRQFNPFMPQFAFGPGGPGGPGGMNMRLANGRLGSTRQRFTQNNPQQNQLPTGNKQAVKIGESLSNGYTLTAVGRASATLVRGSDRVELVLQDPSRVKGSRSSGARPRANAQQQFMQAHMATQQMMLRTMQSMQRSMNGGGGGFGGRGFGGGGGRGGRR